MGHYDNVQEALPRLMGSLLNHGSPAQSRIGESVEMLAQTLHLERPWERFHTVKHRNANPFAQLAETLWVLAGHDSIEWLEWYLPRAKDFSDDGKTWRAAYGPRLRRWGGSVDQVARVVNELRANPNSRRAVVSLWSPEDDTDINTKDIPCNNWLQFILRDGELHMHVTTRSNDVMWGWSGINTFEWSFLQEVLANSLGARPGPATYFIGSLHLYAPYYDRARKIAEQSSAVQAFDPYRDSEITGLDGMTLDGLDHWLTYSSVNTATFFEQEAQLRTDPRALDRLVHPNDCGIESDILRALDGYARWKRRDLPESEITERLYAINHEDLHIAAKEWWERQRGRIRNIRSASDIATATTMEMLVTLQASKARSYGESWRKYGERGSIFANIARKFDRLDNIISHLGTDSPTLMEFDHGSESILDTMVDLGVYACLYYSWLRQVPFEKGITTVFDYMQGAIKHRNRLDRWDDIKRSFYAIAELLGMVPTTAHPAYSNTQTASLALAAQCFEWVVLNRNECTSTWYKFADEIAKIVKAEAAMAAAAASQEPSDDNASA